MSTQESRSLIGPLFLVGVPVAVLALFGTAFFVVPRGETYEVEYTDYDNPEPPPGPTLEDDKLEDKNPEFDPELVDSRPLDGWEVDASAAVIRLDCPIIKPDLDPELLELHSSYAAADLDKKSLHNLPSANLIDGANKQFDDGLFAALEVATFRGSIAAFPALPQLVQEIAAKLSSGSPARPFLAAALSLAGQNFELTDAEQSSRDTYLADFNSDELRSKPISFYNWTEELQTIWKTYRFIQTELCQRVNLRGSVEESRIVWDIAAVLKSDQKLQKFYAAATGFYMSLTNPASCLSMNALVGQNTKPLEMIAYEWDVRRATVAFLPPVDQSRDRVVFISLPARTAERFQPHGRDDRRGSLRQD
jgi:hypothetical protein